MPVIRMNYLDLSPEQRKEGAKPVKDRIKATLASPGLAPDQIQHLHNQLNTIDQWEKGAIKVPDSKDTPPTEEKVNPLFVQKLKELATEGR